MSKKKNKSKRVPDGRTLQTRDEFFYGQGKYRKPGYEKKGHYRRVVVIDSNSNDELAVVKLTGDKGTLIKDYKSGHSGYKPFVLTLDEKGKAIKPGYKFIENKDKHNLSKKNVVQIKKDCFVNSKSFEKNIARIRKLKGRKKRE